MNLKIVNRHIAPQIFVFYFKIGFHIVSVNLLETELYIKYLRITCARKLNSEY